MVTERWVTAVLYKESILFFDLSSKELIIGIEMKANLATGEAVSYDAFACPRPLLIVMQWF